MRIARFQYSLRLLMLGVIVASAVVLSVVTLQTTIDLESILGSPLVFLYGIGGVLLLTTLGEAVAGRAGAVIGAVSAAAIWLLLLYMVLLDFSDAKKYAQHFVLHAVAAGLTLAIVTFIVFRRERPIQSDEDNETVKHLLDFQHRRRNRK